MEKDFLKSLEVPWLEWPLLGSLMSSFCSSSRYLSNNQLKHPKTTSTVIVHQKLHLHFISPHLPNGSLYRPTLITLVYSTLFHLFLLCLVLFNANKNITNMTWNCTLQEGYWSVHFMSGKKNLLYKFLIPNIVKRLLQRVFIKFQPMEWQK